MAKKDYGIHSSLKPRFDLLAMAAAFIVLASFSSTCHRRGLAAAASVVGASSSQSSTSPFDVGVILDLNTRLGKICWSLMLMAVDDFYAAKPDYQTRLKMHLRDTDRNDVVAAAAAALDLIGNVKVEAIVGPQASAQARFIIELGNKTQVPVLSLSARSLHLIPSSESPYFIRAEWNDSSQATVIASLIATFHWMEVVLVVEDTDYGHAIIPYLINAFHEIGVSVPYRSMIPTSATENQIVEELNKLSTSRTRVFIVHMTYSLGQTFFPVAKKVGMMEDGYVWITTYGLSELDLVMTSSANDAMQGVVGVKPYNRNSKRLLDLKERWIKQVQKSYSDANLKEPTMYGLWSYDIVWSLAIAAEKLDASFPFPEINSTSSSSSSERQDRNSSTDLAKLGSSPRGSALLHILVNTKFSGVSGEFQVIDGQLQSSYFEIINLVPHGARTVGYWTQMFGISRHMNAKFDLKPILWPGGNKIPPKGWEWPTKGKRLKIGVPVKPGFDQFVSMKIDTVTQKPNFTGYCIEVFEAVMKLLPYNVSYDYYSFEDSKGAMNGTYDDLIYQVYLQNYDAVVGDVTILANRSLYVDFTMPYTDSGVSMVVPIKSKNAKSAWAFWDPLAADLWAVSGAFFVFTGIVVWILEHPVNDEFQGQIGDQIGTAFYFSFSTLFLADRVKILSILARIVVVVWVFVALNLQQSYTASFTSRLTLEQLQPTLTEISQLVKNNNFVGYLNDSFMPELLRQLHINDSKLIAYESPHDYNEALANRTVAAIVDEIPYLKLFLSKYCKKYAMVGPTLKTGGFGFVFPKGSPLVRDISRAILNVTGSNTMVELEKKLYNGSTCNEDVDGHTTSSSLSLESFWGLFIISGGTSLAALLVHLICYLYELWHIGRDVSEDRITLYQLMFILARQLINNQKDVSSDASSKKDEARDHGAEVAAGTIAFPFTPSRLSLSDYHSDGNATPDDDDDDQQDDEDACYYDYVTNSDILPEDEDTTPGSQVAAQVELRS